MFIAVLFFPSHLSAAAYGVVVLPKQKKSSFSRKEPSPSPLDSELYAIIAVGCSSCSGCSDFNHENN